MKRGKYIYITKEEAWALSNAIEDVRGLTESSDQEYADAVNKPALYSFEDKMIRKWFI
jgi:hypothetical protein